MNVPNNEDGVQDNNETEEGENMNHDNVDGRSEIIKEQSMNQSQQFSGNNMEKFDDDENYPNEQMNNDEFDNMEVKYEENEMI